MSRAYLLLLFYVFVACTPEEVPIEDNTLHPTTELIGTKNCSQGTLSLTDSRVSPKQLYML
jgi:hypothetical protein